ncbi:MAG: GNAT family N-acetyltransferase [Actinomycetota bacterium]|nr:GNAT family N-acetyltransferase [Actinomycetota bacterium]
MNAEDDQGFVVRPLQDGDLAAAAQMQARELADGFLAQLGPGFLRAYLQTFLDTPGAVAFAADSADGQFAGFLVGSTTVGHNRVALRRHWKRLLPAGAAALLRRPRLLPPFLRTRAVRYVRAAVTALKPRPAATEVASEQATEPTTAAGPSRPAVLLHVVVGPDERGQGVGAALVQAFVGAAREAGSSRAVLVSIGGEKDFYLRQGWQRLAARQDDDGRVVVTYGRTL